jgi:hypothetical protein
MFRLGSNISGSTFWNLEQEPDKSGWDLAAEELGLARTCLGWGLDISGLGFLNPVKNPDMSGIPGNFGLEIGFDDLHFIN